MKTSSTHPEEGIELCAEDSGDRVVGGRVSGDRHESRLTPRLKQIQRTPFVTALVVASSGTTRLHRHAPHPRDVLQGHVGGGISAVPEGKGIILV